MEIRYVLCFECMMRYVFMVWMVVIYRSPWHTFIFPSSKNKNKFTLMELSSPKIKKCLTFSQKKAFLIFWGMEPPKFLKFSHTSGNRTFSKKNLIYQEGLAKPTNKTFFIICRKKILLHFRMTADQSFIWALWQSFQAQARKKNSP